VISCLRSVVTRSRTTVFGELAITVIAAAALAIVSIFTFRLVDGFAFSISTLAAGALVYTLGSIKQKWA
jgi:ABC-type branched-subunit amino acid transport system permease subunit